MTTDTLAQATDAPALPPTMTAVVQEQYGTEPEAVLGVGEVAVPTPADDEVLVRVHAAGVDRGTWHLMAGRPYLARVAGIGVRRPKNPVPGLDLAGVVVAVGAEVTRFALGDEVYGISRGSFAEYARAKEAKLALKPPRLSFTQAAAVPVSGLTALQAVRDQGRVEAGQRVLVLGASGGVGSFAVQVAKDVGAEVTGVASPAKLDLVRGLGADHVLDHTRAEIGDAGERYDVILDIGGNRPLSVLRRALTPRGRLVITGGEGGGRWIGGVDRQLRALILSPFVGPTLTTFISAEDGDDLRVLTGLIESGAVTPSVDRTYPLDEAAAAIRHLQDGRARGKVVVTVA